MLASDKQELEKNLTRFKRFASLLERSHDIAYFLAEVTDH